MAKMNILLPCLNLLKRTLPPVSTFDSASFRRIYLASTRFTYVRTVVQKKLDQSHQSIRQFCEKHDLKENIYTIPNALCIFRIAGSPFVGYLIVSQQFNAALILTVAFGLTDLVIRLDGYIARNFKNQSSYLGSALDPLADKILVTTLVVTMAYSNLLPIWLASIIIFRDVCLLVGGFYLRYRTLDPPRTLAKYFDLKTPTVQMKPTLISKINTAMQLSLVAFCLAAPVFHFVNHPLIEIGWYATAVTTILSGISYLSIDKNFKKIN